MLILLGLYGRGWWIVSVWRLKLIPRMKEMVGLAPTAPAVTKKNADINIFTVASGLLYEVRATLEFGKCKLT
jgi:hypothetical protein